MPQPLVTPATAQLIGYGLVLGGSVIVGKILIDNFVGEVNDKKARSAFIGPVWEPVKVKGEPFHAKASEAVKFVVMAVSVYQIIAKLPELASQWGDVQKQLATISQLP